MRKEGRKCGRTPKVFNVKKVFLEISQNLQESTCARVSFLIKLQALGLRCFPVNFMKFLRAPFLQNTSGRLLLEGAIKNVLHHKSL